MCVRIKDYSLWAARLLFDVIQGLTSELVDRESQFSVVQVWSNFESFTFVGAPATKVKMLKAIMEPFDDSKLTRLRRIKEQVLVLWALLLYNITKPFYDAIDSVMT